MDVGGGRPGGGEDGVVGGDDRAVLVPSHRLRAEAFGVDVAVVVVVFGLALVLEKVTQLSAFGLVAVGAVGWIYYVGVTAWLMEGQSAGKIICGLRVRSVRTGVAPRSPRGVLWSVGRHTVGYVVVDVFLLGALLALFDRRRRCLHDYGFSSEVTQMPPGTRPGPFLARYRAYWEEFAEQYEQLTKRSRWFFFPWKWLSKALIVVALLFDKFLGASPAEGTPSVAPVEPAKWLSGKAIGGLWVTSTMVTGIIAGAAWPVDPSPDPVASQNIVFNFGTTLAPSRQEIYLARPDGSNLQRLTHNDTEDTGPDLFADRRIVFVSYRDGNAEIYLMNADGSDQTRLTFNDSQDICPAWSPDGTQIAFASDREGARNLYLMNADGSNQEPITSNATDDWCPDWSPDGDSLVFVSDRDQDPEIYTMPTVGSGLRQLTHNSAEEADPTWSPDGRWIAFTSDRDGDQNIYLVDADGGAETRVTDDPARDWYPRWAPSGDKLTFVSERGLATRGSEYYITNPDGSGQTRLTSINDCGPDTSTCHPD